MAMPVPFAFVDGALDRADALRDAPEALAQAWPGARVILVDAHGRASPRDIAGASLGDVADAVFLGRDDDGRAWFADALEARAIDPGERVDLRTAAAGWPLREATAFAQARAVLHWRASHRHCAACGAALGYSRGGWQGDCAGCGRTHYPRTDPAVIVAVGDGERLLLGRQSGWPARRWSVLAGFVEPGETLEQTVAREVMEETGVRVRGSRYLASQPWPFPSSLMLGFIADAHPDPPVATAELEDARWFDADAVRAGLAADWRDADGEGDGIVLSPPLSISRWLVERWLASLAG